MLRLLVLVLLLLNGAYFAWGQGWLMVYGFGPAPQREPQRLTRQIHPEAVTVLSEREATKALQADQTAAQPKKLLCLQSPLLDETQAQTVRAALQQAAWPDPSWQLVPAVQTERWLVYMGKFNQPVDLEKKRVQLGELKISFENLSNAPLTPGLSLGAFDTQAKASAALEALARRGVRSARVLQERPALEGVRLRLHAVDDGLLAQLTTVRGTWGGQALAPCTDD